MGRNLGPFTHAAITVGTSAVLTPPAAGFADPHGNPAGTRDVGSQHGCVGACFQSLVTTSSWEIGSWRMEELWDQDLIQVSSDGVTCQGAARGGEFVYGSLLLAWAQPLPWTVTAVPFCPVIRHHSLSFMATLSCLHCPLPPSFPKLETWCSPTLSSPGLNPTNLPSFYNSGWGAWVFTVSPGHSPSLIL